MSPRRFSLEVPPGFRGLDPYRDVRHYQRHLPHWRQDGATYFVTFRQADSLPRTKLDELKVLKKQWANEIEKIESDKKHKASLEDIHRKTFVKMEQWLDRGYGSCLLRDPGARKAAADALKYFDGERYEIGAGVIMPNHVHLIMRPHDGNELEDLLQGRKSNMSREINAHHQGIADQPFWQQESYDRIIRDGQHLWRCIQYIGRNGTKANLNENEYSKWVKPEWIDLGWGFENAE